MHTGQYRIFYRSVRPVLGRLLINVDVANGVVQVTLLQFLSVVVSNAKADTSPVPFPSSP